MKKIVLLALLLTPFAVNASGDDAASFFDDSEVKEIHIYFSNPNWYNTLYQAHNTADDPYFPATLSYGDTTVDNIGVRFKGNSSFRISSIKKSFKLDFNEFNDETRFLGLKKLNLNNLDLEPDMLREKMFLDFASKYIAAMRAVHVRVYVNDVYYGLYLAVEQPDKTMMRDRFGDNEDGNLFNAGESNADLAYHGDNQASYYNYYTLETNETANDWSDLVEFIDVLNNTATADLPAKLEPICDVENMLYGTALNILFTNVDSYLGSASEFYLYDRDDIGKFVHIHWDLNEGFGTTGDGSPTIANPFTADPFWLPSSSSGGGPGGGPGGGGGFGGGSRPLAKNLWAVTSYKRTYLRMLARMLREGFDTVNMQARINQLANLIRDDVYADPNKIYTNAQFESALTTGTTRGMVSIYGLQQFVTERYNYLHPILEAYAEPADVRLNELMTVNTSSLSDGAGDNDPWLEIYNLGPGTVSLSNFYLTDDTSNPTKFALPAQNLSDGGFSTLWLDGETGEGENHVSFRPQTSGGTIYLYQQSGSTSTLIDSVSYPALTENKSLIRIGSLGSQWLVTDKATSGAENPRTGTNPWAAAALLRINEFMASNSSFIADPDEADAFEDWIEIYNPGTTAVDMSGMYLTDSMQDPTRWQVPQGAIIPAGGYLIFWADNDPSQGSMHADFKLDADGEELALYNADGTTLIDAIVYESQLENISYGRRPDAIFDWVAFDSPTPGAANRLESAKTLSIQTGGSGTASTTGSGGSIKTGFATVTSDSGTVPYGTAVYSLTQNNTVVSEAGVPASSPTTAARLFIDYRSDVPAIAGQPEAGTINLSTGIALTNTGSVSASITYSLRDVDGEPLASGSGSLNAGAQAVKYIHELYQIASGFELPANFASDIGFGTLEIASDQPLAIMAVRLTNNQRNDTLLTNTSVSDLNKQASTTPVYFPQIADGGGYVTTIVLLNTSDTTETGLLKIYDNAGLPLAVTNTTGGYDSVFEYSIEPNGILVFETDGSPAGINVGSAQAIPDSGSIAPSGACLYRLIDKGVVVSESGSPAAVATTHARIYVDQSSGHDTGVALAALDGEGFKVTLQAYQTDGVTSAGGGSEEIDLAGNGHAATFTAYLISDLPENFTGVLDIQAPKPFAALTIRSFKNTRNEFLVTTFPTADMTATISSPVVFPQIADGAGYSTQFVLINAGEDSDATISVFSNGGSPLSVLK
jgi:spore coat protein CotH